MSLELTRVRVLLECLVVLVHGIIGQMDELVSQVGVLGVERLGSKSHQSILVQIEPAAQMKKVPWQESSHFTPDGVNAGEENVEPQVELETVD